MRLRARIGLLAALTAIGGLLVVGCARKTPTGLDTRSQTSALQGIDLSGKYIPPGLHIDRVSPPPPRVSLRKSCDNPPPFWENDYGIPLNMSDDGSRLVDIGFDFEFYDHTYSRVWVNSNGNLTFNRSNKDYWHPQIPDGDLVIIAPLYGDFNPRRAGDVYVNHLGEAPNRRLIVTWVDVPEYGDPADYGNTFQVQLIEKYRKDQNIVVFGYKQLSTDGINWNYREMAVGISSGQGDYILTAKGEEIPRLLGWNVLYLWKRNHYEEGRVNSDGDTVGPLLTFRNGSFRQ